MSTRLNDLLIDLSKDPFKCEAFRMNPEQILNHTDLDPAERTLLVEGDSEAVGLYLVAKKKKAASGKNKRTNKKSANKNKRAKDDGLGL